MSLKVIKLTKAHKAGYHGYKWAIDVDTTGYDYFPVAKEFLEVRRFCEESFGPALEYDLYYSLRSYGTGMIVPPNPHWCYDFSTVAKCRSMIYLRTDADLNTVKEHFGIQ